jgi:Domain of unknown function (DUF4394)
MPRIPTAHRLSFGVAIVALAVTALPVGSNAAVPPVCNERAAGGSAVGYALTSRQQLVCFKINSPQTRQVLMSTSALAGADTELVGIDARPASGAIYGLGNAGGLYVLDPTNSKPEFRARLSVALEGRNFGVDFNPTVDRLRIVTDSGQNLRVNVDTGAATVDANLKFGTARANGVAAVAYTNNDSDASTATTLFNIDSIGDQLTIQNPPNDGALTSVGRLNFSGSAVHTFDIQSTLREGKAVDNVGYAALDGGGTLFRVNLTNGDLTFLGNTGADRFIGITFPTL